MQDPVLPSSPPLDPASVAGLSCCFYNSSPGDLTADRNIGLLIRHLHVLMHRVIDLRTMPLGLTANQWRPLLLVRYKGIDTPAELARTMNVDTGAMTRMLDRLETKGFVRRDRIAEDRRVVKVTLTDIGCTLTEQILPIIADALNLHLQGFSEDEIRMLLALLKRMIHNGEQVLQQVSEATAS
ncbi:MarR family transcriptional regulator [Castellaniella sp.]|uniref:MarR family winged helix-turn-helix transcriptional regulator n=1 Tax=Castellaniella sp. TaxID=1955812 RepID=UPI002AFF83D9|nr:MarR family transcriptional regulator [Castellaniella sp.]